MSDSEESRRDGEAEAQGERIVPMRLQKFLARAGVASRRGSENLMTAGRVCVNGVVVTELGSKVDPRIDVVTVDGQPVRLEDGSVTLLLNKPAGYLTTMDDPQGRPCVADLVPSGRYPGLFPIGRLDKDTTGALLFSTDGEFGNGLMHPRHHVDKTYYAQVQGAPRAADLQKMREGLKIKVGEEWRQTAPADVALLKALPAEFAIEQSCLKAHAPGASILEIRIHQGMKHQVKLMCGKIGHPVIALHRVAFGPIVLRGLALGAYRVLDADEVDTLRKSVGD